MYMSTMNKEARVPETTPRPGQPGYLPPKPKATATMELITPEIAADYLARMHSNRTVSKIERGVMAQLLRDEEFYGEISPVYFDDKGDFIAAPGEQDPWDGQHRFLSIVETGIPAWMWVVRGIREEVSQFVDTGRRRMYSDNLRIAGVNDYSRQSVLARQMAMYELFGIDSVRNPNTFPLTRTQMDKWVDAPGMVDAIHLGQALYRAAGLSEGAAAYAVMRTVRVDERDEKGRPVRVTVDPTGFWADVRDDDGLLKGTPAKTLRDWSLRTRRSATRTPADKRLLTHYALAVSWNKHITGQRYTMLQPSFERKRNGDLYFPARNVPDFKVPGSAARELGEAREAYDAVRKDR